MLSKPLFRKRVFKLSFLNYHMPTSIDELSAQLTKNDSYTGIIAGGTDFMIKLRNHPERFNRIIDISGIATLKSIVENSHEIVIGALVTLTEIEESNLIKLHMPALAMAAGKVGSTQIRNRGTIAGNIANASPCADTVPPLMAYDAQLKVMDSRGIISIRTVDEVLIGMGKNTLANDEVIVEIIIPKSKKVNLSAFEKLGSRKAVSISKLNLCIGLEYDSDKVVTDARICVGSLGPKAFRVLDVEALCKGYKLGEDLQEAITLAMVEEVEKAIKGRSSMPYKRRAIKGLVEDVFSKLMMTLNSNDNGGTE